MLIPRNARIRVGFKGAQRPPVRHSGVPPPPSHALRRRWVSERLEMGDESRVTQAIRQVKRNLHPELARMKKRLEQEYGGDR